MKTVQINFRADVKLRDAIEALRSRARPIPSVGQVLREAVLEKYAREMKQPKKRNGGNQE